jgi:hypothetical protein
MRERERGNTKKDWGRNTKKPGETGKRDRERPRARTKTERKDGEKQNQGKVLVHQPAAPRAFTTIVFVLNGEDWTEN